MSRQDFKVRLMKQEIKIILVPSKSYFKIIFKKCVN